MLAVISALLCFIFAAAFIFWKKQYRYWKELGIAGPEPVLLLGNMGDMYSLKGPESLIMDKWYKEFKDEPYIGYYNLWKPVLIVKDPELMKAITEVDFNHFTDHIRFCGTTNSDAIMDSLLTMKGTVWKDKRQFFSKLFAPKKLKDYCEIMNHYCSALFREIDEHSERFGEVQLEEIAKRHMIRTTSHIAYSIDVSQNEEVFSNLHKLSEVFARPPFTTVIKFSFYTLSPRLFEFLSLRTFPREIWDFFSNLTKALVQSRIQGKTGNEDVVSLVAQLQEEGTSNIDKISHSEAVGHIFSFFEAGHDTTLETLTFALFQLSRNQEVQEKLRDEVDNVLSGNEHVSYDSVMKMKYLQNVIDETLRMFPVIGVLNRICTLPYKINEKFTIPKDMDVMFPAYSFHMDPKYFPDPEKFLPERFSDLEKSPPAFMPFGKGPRTCIGKRLAYLLVMVALAKIISNYTILPSPSTEFPIKYDPRTVIITSRPLQELKVRMQKREKTKFS